MKILRAFCLAVTTYSKIPMIRVYPNKDNMRYMLCYLPLIGAAVGGLLWLWFSICMALYNSFTVEQIQYSGQYAEMVRTSTWVGDVYVFFATVATVIPVLLTGGIHVDGYIDTQDALRSYASKQKKLEILGDPHVGAFAVISAIVYFVLYFGMFASVSKIQEVAMLGCGFVLSRIVCGMTVALMRPAKQYGMIYEVHYAANKIAVTIILTIWLIICGVAMILQSPYIGGLIIIVNALLLLYYKFFVAKRIGGITGDTCGWLIQMSELLTLITLVIGTKLIPLMPAALTGLRFI